MLPLTTFDIDEDKRHTGQHPGRLNEPSCNEKVIVLHGDQHNKRITVPK